jgi:transporter family-2 protein
MKVVWLLIVFVCGALLPIQAGLNTRLGKFSESPLYASFLSFLVGAIIVAICLPFTKESVSWMGLKSAPVSVWIGGGVTGAIFITATMLAVPRLGMALTFGLVVAGQVVMAVLLDQFNIMVAEQHPVNIWRILGIVLIVGGTVLVQKF